MYRRYGKIQGTSTVKISEENSMRRFTIYKEGLL